MTWTHEHLTDRCSPENLPDEGHTFLPQDFGSNEERMRHLRLANPDMDNILTGRQDPISSANHGLELRTQPSPVFAVDGGQVGAVHDEVSEDGRAEAFAVDENLDKKYAAEKYGPGDGSGLRHAAEKYGPGDGTAQRNAAEKYGPGDGSGQRHAAEKYGPGDGSGQRHAAEKYGSGTGYP